MNDGIKTVAMQLVTTHESKGEFTFDMQARNNPGRTVRFSIDQIDATQLMTALQAYLSSPKG